MSGICRALCCVAALAGVAGQAAAAEAAGALAPQGVVATGDAVAPSGEAGSEIHGRVVNRSGEPVVAADVFLLETLEGGLTGDGGRFRIATDHTGPATVIVHHVGYSEARVSVTLPRAEPLVLVVEVREVPLEPIRARAGAYAMGAGEAQPLTPLDVVTTAGTHADVMQAVAALPGAQPVEEGAALYVRGGDVSETKVVLDGATVLAPYRFESGLVSFGTFDPFALEGIAFSTGGFGARHGNALSGLLELRTAGVPGRREAAATASVGALAGRLHVPFGGSAGLRVAANRSSTTLLHRLNGHDTDFVTVPESRNIGGSLAWDYRPGGVLKVFGYDEWNRFAARLDEPSHTGAYTAEDESAVLLAAIRDVAGAVGFRGTVAFSRRAIDRAFGAFALQEQERLLQARAEFSRTVAPWLLARVGGGIHQHRARIAGSHPEAESDVRPGAPVTAFGARIPSTRGEVFAEVELRPLDRLELTVGVRRDASSLTGEATWDPRLGAVLRVARGAYLTGAFGIYHQVPEPLAYDPTVGDPSLPAMVSRNAIVGVVLEGDVALVRLEAYDKQQARLAQETRAYRYVGGGEGHARGLDVFIRGRGPLGLEGRASYSYIRAERTDPNTGVLARSPFEIRHALTLVLERAYGPFRLGGTYRYATGRPYTPVVEAEHDGAAGVWRPVYGAPMSALLPRYGRLDATAQLLHSFTGDDLTVLFLSVTNILDRRNVAALRYSSDYSEAEPIESAFRRTFYFGITTTLPF